MSENESKERHLMVAVPTACHYACMRCGKKEDGKVTTISWNPEKNEYRASDWDMPPGWTTMTWATGRARVPLCGDCVALTIDFMKGVGVGSMTERK